MWQFLVLMVCLIGVMFLMALAYGLCQAAGRADAWLDEFERQREETLREQDS